jgi:glucose-6-phosphate isomerase
MLWAPGRRHGRPGQTTMTLDQLLSDHAASRLASRIWARDPAVFVGLDAPASVNEAILNRLGWLDAPTAMPGRAAEVDAFRQQLAHDRLTDIYLLGMGGSSLCAEVLRDVLGVPGHANRLVVLDTTDEQAVHQVAASLVPEKSCFIVASKSGSTLEVTSLESYFWSLMERAVSAPGRHFAAITDPGTSLVAHAADRQYRHVFINPADIGGRYSALSLFGLVPAAMVGISGATLLATAQEMADACSLDSPANPGLSLGVFMGSQAAAGRDKLTFFGSPALAPLGAWIEQLVAESTGKLGRGVLPIVGEPAGPPERFGADRAFVLVTTPDDQNARRFADGLEAAGHPVFRIETEPAALGAEFFRWEFATAVAGAVLGLNPFDEPDVRSAKTRTQAQLDAHASGGTFRIHPPLEEGRLYRRRDHAGGGRPGAAGSYVAILDYLPADPARADAINRLRATLRGRLGVATTHGVGPRYLHSTGQYHKGGPNTGVFILVTSDDASVTPVPGTGYSFSVLKLAQALGDFDALVAGGRTVIHCHFQSHSADVLTRLEHVLASLT